MQDWLKKVDGAKSLDELEEIRIEIFGKKGFLAAEFLRMKELDADAKKELAKELNEIKEGVGAALEAKKEKLAAQALKKQLEKEKIDVALIDTKSSAGALHPVLATMDKMIEYFISMNFSVETGPIVENDFNNFEALNLPKHHPARDMQDTFYMKDSMLLRTHTSSVQIRTMLSQKPPIRMIAPGAVCRRDYDLTHVPMFHQVEGLVVEEGDKVSFANLKSLLEDFLKHMFGDVKVRFRPSFFPFTEPSAEVDISCVLCGGDGCRVCKHTGWLEVLGCGIVDPNVFEAVGYKNVSGYAFGLGVERFSMLLNNTSDMRSLFEGDLRLMEQFV
ncbi:MAG TPA: phenylalanine--tRNA ligase subunit alpha [Campylobacterales bacterium]|nr:phenylalanine--tRNA ligase subunit alpha [Campylobacterales bacterium]